MTQVPQGTRARPITVSGITRTGADWINPPAPTTSWQRDRASGPLLPMETEFTGRQRFATWAMVVLVGVLFWTAFWCLVL